MFRIISGKWKAKRIAAPKNFTVRPTTDFAKEALFSILENRYDLVSAQVLDLFAGIGSISLEFASRGTQDITAVEQNPKHCSFISNTAADLDLHLSLNLQRADVFDWLKKNRQKKSFDIMFADPPFDLPDNKYTELLNLILSNEFLKEDGIFILEHQTRKKFVNEHFMDSRKYGNITFSLYGKNPDAAPASEHL